MHHFPLMSKYYDESVLLPLLLNFGPQSRETYMTVIGDFLTHLHEYKMQNMYTKLRRNITFLE